MPSSEKVVSPGVFTTEIDQTFLPAAIADIGAALIGPTVKGPAGVPTIVNSYSDYQARFGDTFKSGSSYYQYLTSYTAREYLRHGSPLTVVRILPGSPAKASATISSSIDPAIVGGGTQHSASLRLGQPFSGSFQTDMSASMTPYGGTTVNFYFTSSADWASGSVTNTSTEIYFPSCSATFITAASASAIFNASSSLHGLTDISASANSSSQAIDFTYVAGGSFGLPIGQGNPHTNNTPARLYGGSSIDRYINLTSSKATFSGSKNFTGGSDYSTTFTTPFKLHTIGDGAVMNSIGTIGTFGLLESGSGDNLRWEISSVNRAKGTFSLLIRRGNDTAKRKQTLESFKNLTLDPLSKDYIGKVIGDQYWTLNQSGGTDPYLSLTGKYPNRSKYVRVETLIDTVDYLDENGTIRVNAASASLPSFASGSSSGSFAGAFSGGTDGNLQHPQLFYNSITDSNSQGLDLATAANGKTAYEDAINLLGNADEYDINLVLMPGVIDNGTGGGSLITKAIDMCEDRGDCFVIADPTFHNAAIGTATAEAEARDSSYAATYWPWVQISDPDLGKNPWVPPSVAMAGVYSFNDKVGYPWLAPAGLNRGVIDSVTQAERRLTHSNRDTLYDSSVNPLTTFPGQGVCVWGQKTLQKKLSALDRVNVRRLLIKVKKFIASTSRFLVFEQNNSSTRSRFLNIVNPYLEQVQSNAGLNAFRVVMDETNNTPDLVDRNILYGQIFLQPTRTAEFIVLDFTVQPTGATFPE